MFEDEQLEYVRKVKAGDNTSYSMYARLQFEDEYPFIEIFRDWRDSCVTHRMTVKDVEEFIEFLDKCLDHMKPKKKTK